MTDNPDNNFRIFVRIQLAIKGWSITQLAMVIGYPRETVSAAINQIRHPYVIQAIAKELKYDTDTNGPLPISPARPEKRERAGTSPHLTPNSSSSITKLS